MTVKDFISNKAIELLKEMDTLAKPAWGIMTPQHMVEHLSIVTRISNGKMKVDIKTPADKIEKAQAFLMSEAPLPKEFKAPYLPKDELIPLHHPNMEAAINGLAQEIDDFYTFYEGNESATNNHPIFGALNLEKWEKFQHKHFTHHLTQFNLL